MPPQVACTALVFPSPQASRVLFSIGMSFCHLDLAYTIAVDVEDLTYSNLLVATTSYVSDYALDYICNGHMIVSPAAILLTTLVVQLIVVGVDRNAYVHDPPLVLTS